jgi:hypothetical protein
MLGLRNRSARIREIHERGQRNGLAGVRFSANPARQGPCGGLGARTHQYDPSPPAAASHTNPMVESKALYYAGKRSSLHDADFHNKEQPASSQCGDR